MAGDPGGRHRSQRSSGQAQDWAAGGGPGGRRGSGRQAGVRAVRQGTCGQERRALVLPGEAPKSSAVAVR